MVAVLIGAAYAALGLANPRHELGKDLHRALAIFGDAPHGDFVIPFALLLAAHILVVSILGSLETIAISWCRPAASWASRIVATFGWRENCGAAMRTLE